MSMENKTILKVILACDSTGVPINVKIMDAS